MSLSIKKWKFGFCRSEQSIKKWRSSYGNQKLKNHNFFFFKVLREHESDVNCIIQFNDDRIASGTKDRTIRIWKIDNVEENVKKKFYTMEEVLTDYSHGMYCLIKRSLFNLKFFR